MEDLLFVTKCDHKISNYILDIKTDKEGYYYVEFPFDIICIKNMVFIRSWSDEQKYLASIDDYRDLAPYISINRSTQQISGANNEIGITDYIFVNKRIIKFTPVEGHRQIDLTPGKIPQNIYLIDMYADSGNCPRCEATGVVKDLNITSNGKLIKATGKNKIKQRVWKALMTPLGMQPYNQTFGSELNSMVGDVVSDTTRIVLQKTIVNCIDNLIKEQPADLDDSERIYSLQGITIDTPDQDKTAFLVKVIVLSADGEYIDCSIGFNLGDNNAVR